MDHLICQGGGRRFKNKLLWHPKAIKKSTLDYHAPLFDRQKLFALFITGGKNSCKDQILHSPPPPSLPKKTICLVYHWGKNSCTGQILHSPPPPPKKLFALFISGGKILALVKSCPPTPIPKNYLPCLSVGKKFLHQPNLHYPPPTPQNYLPCLSVGKIFHPPPKGPKKCQMVLPFLVIVLTVNVIAALMVSRMKPILTQGSIYMCAFWQFVLRSMSKP